MDSIGNKLNQASSYTDFSALAELRAKATSVSGEKNDEALREVSKQFESLFLQMMLKSMRDATYIDEGNESDQTRFYQDMFDKQVALDLSNRPNGGIGLANTMQQQLGANNTTQNSPEKIEPSLKPFDLDQLRFRGNKPIYDQAMDNQAMHNQIKTDELNSANKIEQGEANWKPESPEEFTKEVWSHATAAANQLGVKPEVLVAQSALETGWGKKMISHADGQSANNLFGIKADSRWQGDKASVSTLEFRDGVAAKEKAEFRSYDSIADSFNDYVQFLKNSPRYENALANASDSKAYLQNLQDAGYSTDPAYAEKIQAIMQRSSMQTFSDSETNKEGLAVAGLNLDKHEVAR